MSASRACAVLAALGAGLSVAATPAAATPSSAQLQRLADAVVAAGVPGVTLAVADGPRVRRAASGVVERGRGARLRPSARFRVASVTKPMTAALVLRLAEQGRLRLDDPVGRWVPELPADARAVPVGRLLDHTSGFGEYYDPDVILKPYLDGDAGFVWPALALVRRGLAAPPPRRAPSGFAYSDTNYVLAGIVAQRAGDAPLATLLQRLVFAPLGMRSTAYATRAGLPPRIAHGYADAGGPQLLDTTALSPSIAQAAGAVVSDAEDLLRFERGLLGGRLLRPSSLRAMRRTVAMGLGFPSQDGYGLGLWRTRRFALLPRAVGCGALWGHNGSTVGYTSYAFASPDGRHRFAVLTSTDALGPRATRALQRLVAAVAC